MQHPLKELHSSIARARQLTTTGTGSRKRKNAAARRRSHTETAASENTASHHDAPDLDCDSYQKSLVNERPHATMTPRLG